MEAFRNMFRGTGLCARFTFRQSWKNKANLWSFIILSLTVVLMPYLYSMGYHSAAPDQIKNIYYINDSDLKIPDFSDISDYRRSFEEVSLHVVNDRNEIPPLETEDLILTFSAYDAKPVFTFETAENCSFDSYTVESLIYAIKPQLVQELYVKQGIPAEIVAKMGYPESYNMCYTSEYSQLYAELHAEETPLPNKDDESPKEDVMDPSHEADGPDYETVVNLQMAFSVLMMMISILTASYIIREIITEKSSKLVDLLMVCMKAQALLLGKILGVLSFVLSMMAGIFAVYQGSNLVKEKLLHVKSGTDIFASFAGALKGVGADVILVFLLSLLFGILLFALISGLMGAGCSTEEDTSQALGLPMILIMGAYMGSIFLTLFTDGNVLPVLSLIPVLSTFILPIQYLLGNINIFIVLASLVIQLFAIFGLVYLSGKLYASLMVYRGKRLSLTSMLRMVGPGGKEEN